MHSPKNDLVIRTPHAQKIPQNSRKKTQNQKKKKKTENCNKSPPHPLQVDTLPFSVKQSWRRSWFNYHAHLPMAPGRWTARITAGRKGQGKVLGETTFDVIAGPAHRAHVRDGSALAPAGRQGDPAVTGGDATDASVRAPSDHDGGTGSRPPRGGRRGRRSDRKKKRWYAGLVGKLSRGSKRGKASKKGKRPVRPRGTKTKRRGRRAATMRGQKEQQQ
jgi:hypothetical protein